MKQLQMDNVFNLFDFSNTHKVLLFRGININHDEKPKVLHENIDLLFQTVKYMDLVTTLKNPLIKVYEEAETYPHLELLDISEPIYKRSKLFILESDARKFHIISSGLEIIKNYLPVTETSIGVKRIESYRKEILYNF